MRRAFAIVVVFALAAGATFATSRGELLSSGTAPVTAVTLIHGIPGHEAELREHLSSLTAPTLAERGCLRYDLYQSPEKAHEFMRYEVWASAEALEAHKRTPHLRASFERRQQEGWTTEILLWQPVPAGGAAR